MSTFSLKLFEIKGLFNIYDVELPLDKNVNVFIGENGLGKTTILNCLYYVLDDRIEKLKDIVFDKIKITFIDGSFYEISYLDVVAYSEDYMYGGYIQHKSFAGIERVFSKYELSKLEFIILHEENSSMILRDYSLKFSDIMGVPMSIAEREIRRYIASKVNRGKPGDYKNVLKFKDALTDKCKNKVLYFPTYRRIEEDLSKLDIDVENKIIKHKLIRFGMEDVNSMISKTLEEIKSLAITGFTQMTGLLLKQYLRNDLSVDSEYKIDIEKLKIALERIGNKIEGKDKELIKALVQSGEIYTNKNIYLINLIKNLIDSYEKQAVYDERVKNFYKICNKYLKNKRFEYNESKVELEILRDENDEEIKIQNLSSGEKQIISLFSRLYLEENKDCIILFDEPELSLSIKWQAKLLPDIMKSNTSKMLVTVTHSPFIFDNEFDSLACNMKDCMTIKKK